MQKKKIIAIVAAALFGAGLGAYLSYGPLQKFKSEAELNIEMSTADFKRFSVLVSDQTRFKEYATRAKSMALSNEQLEAVLQIVEKNDWYKPVPRVSKVEYKDLPDAVIRLEQEDARKKELALAFEVEKMFGKDLNVSKSEFTAYPSLRITSLAAERQLAVDQLAWLGAFAQNTAITDAMNILIEKWTNENRLFAEHFQIKKLKQEFEVQWLKNKIMSLKKAINNYPESAEKIIQQKIEIGADRIKTKSLTAQLISAELDLMEIDFENQKIIRAKEQQDMLEELIKKINTDSNKDKNGLERLMLLDELIVAAMNKTEIPAKREKLLLLMVDISNIKARLMKKPQYIVPATLPNRQDGPAPIKLMILMALLFASLVALYLSRHTFFKYIKENDNPLPT